MGEWVIVPTLLEDAENECDIMFDWHDDDEDLTKPDIYIAKDLSQDDAERIVREHDVHKDLVVLARDLRLLVKERRNLSELESERMAWQQSLDRIDSVLTRAGGSGNGII